MKAIIDDIYVIRETMRKDHSTFGNVKIVGNAGFSFDSGDDDLDYVGRDYEIDRNGFHWVGYDIPETPIPVDWNEVEGAIYDAFKGTQYEYYAEKEWAIEREVCDARSQK